MLKTLSKYRQLHLRHTTNTKRFIPTLLTQTQKRWSTTHTEEDIHRIPPQLDLKYYAENAEAIADNMKLRNYETDFAFRVRDLYHQCSDLTLKAEHLRQERDKVNQNIRQTKTKESRQPFIAQAKEWKDQLKQVEDQLVKLEAELVNQALMIPNDTHPTVPLGPEENAKVIKMIGQPRKSTPEQPLKDHLTLAENLDMVDFEQAALVTGSKFYYLKNYGAWLEFALIQYAMQTAALKGFSPVLAPDMVRTSIAYGCGFQPRKKEASQIYDVTTPSTINTTAPKLCLVGTAEIPLAGMFATKLYKEQELPKKIVGFSHAYRAEAGHGSAEERGLYRVHQFSKVELFTVTTPAQSEDMLQELRTLQEELFTGLGLCFRILDMPTEELGASAFRKYDIEAWMPGKNGWGEVKMNVSH